MHITVVIILIPVIGFLIWAWHDYHSWLALGQGGLPATIKGWLTTTRLRLKKLDAISTHVYLAQPSASNKNHLQDLLVRNGPRPSIAPWPIPHRQLNQFISTDMRRKLDTVFDEAVKNHGEKVHYKTSYFEKYNPAITLKNLGCCHQDARFSEGETAHIHPRDGSMHMIFSERDALVILENGWGERHPLAGVPGLLPSTYLYIYPPRDEMELKVVEMLLEASIQHMSNALQ
jgi:hypothetical protein